ncbi:MAG: GTP-binding protein [Candidatus Hodarchaeales archaeon]|jgi:small GTP-binding protein
MPRSKRAEGLRDAEIKMAEQKRVPILKFCLIGDGGVGKTAIRERYVGASFTKSYLPTIGADFATKTEIVDGIEVKLLIWDLAGQPRFSIVREGYYRGARGILLVFDVARPDSFESAPMWLKESWKHLEHGRSVPLMVIGNKTDLRDQNHLLTRVGRDLSTAPPLIRPAQGHALVHEIKKLMPRDAAPFANYTETSAKTGQNVNSVFNKLTKMILQQADVL